MQFKGTTIGPHKMVLSSLVTPDGALAYVVSIDDDKGWLESSDGRKVSFGGTPGMLKMSPDGRNAAVLVTGRFSMNEQKAMAKLPPDKFMEAAKDINANNLDTIDGKTFGPFDLRLLLVREDEQLTSSGSATQAFWNGHADVHGFVARLAQLLSERRRQDICGLRLFEHHVQRRQEIPVAAGRAGCH